MSFRKSGICSDFSSLDDDSLTDETSNNNEKIIEKDREIRNLKSENAELCRKVLYLENSHGKECADQILKLMSKEKELNEELEFYTKSYNETMTSFTEFKRDVDNKNKNQAETIKNLQHKIKEFENKGLYVPSYIFQQNIPQTTSKEYFVESAINCPSLGNKKKPGFFGRLFSRDSIITATWFLGFNTLLVVLFVHVFMFTHRYL